MLNTASIQRVNIGVILSTAKIKFKRYIVKIVQPEMPNPISPKKKWRFKRLFIRYSTFVSLNELKLHHIDQQTLMEIEI